MLEYIICALSIFGSSQLIAADTPQTNPNLSECSKKLTIEETVFMELLIPYNQNLFCSVFTKKQRNEALQLTGWLDTNGNPMTADQAVQQVAQNNGIVIDMPPLEPPCAPSVQPNR